LYDRETGEAVEITEEDSWLLDVDYLTDVKPPKTDEFYKFVNGKWVYNLEANLTRLEREKQEKLANGLIYKGITINKGVLTDMSLVFNDAGLEEIYWLTDDNKQTILTSEDYKRIVELAVKFKTDIIFEYRKKKNKLIKQYGGK
jgi:glycerophosphoryl diester phosphodiesterase